MTIADLLSVLSFSVTVFALGYQIGFYHGRHDKHRKKKSKK
jgi:hypothetical protein